MVHVIGPRDRKRMLEFKDKGIPIVNTTSSAKGCWSTLLSPFYLGPVYLYRGYSALKMENAWQYSKVYTRHVDAEGNPTPAYFEWAQEGWKNKVAVRYPMGKGIKPEYLWWDGEKIDYIAARKKVYAPLYIKCVVSTKAFTKLKEMRDNNPEIVLWDFDGYDYISLGMTLKDVLNDPTRKMGHAFVLAILLTMKREEILEVLNYEKF